MASALLACGLQTAISRRVFHQSTDTPTNANLSATCRNFTGIVISPRCPHWFPPRLVRWITSQGPHCRRCRWRRVSSRKLTRCLTRLRSLQRLQPRSAWEPEMGFMMSRSPLVVFLTTGLHLLTRRNQNWRARLHRIVARCRPTGPHRLWGRHQPNTMCLSRRVFPPNRVRTVSWIMEKSGYHPLHQLLRMGAVRPRIGDATRLLPAGETARVQRIPAPKRRKMVSQCTYRIVITKLFTHGILLAEYQGGAPRTDGTSTRAVDSFSCGMKTSNLFNIFTSSAGLLDLFLLFCCFQATIIAANRPLKVLIPVHPVQNPALAEESVSDSNICFFSIQNNKKINILWSDPKLCIIRVCSVNTRRHFLVLKYFLYLFRNKIFASVGISQRTPGEQGHVSSIHHVDWAWGRDFPSRQLGGGG